MTVPRHALDDTDTRIVLAVCHFPQASFREVAYAVNRSLVVTYTRCRRLRRLGLIDWSGHRTLHATVDAWRVEPSRGAVDVATILAVTGMIVAAALLVLATALGGAALGRAVAPDLPTTTTTEGATP